MEMTPEDLATLAKLDGRIDEIQNYLTHLEGARYDVDNGDQPRPIVVKYALDDLIEHRVQLLEELYDQRDALFYS
ncbi:hypothetical protein I7X12_07850 [Halosimplex litoreum]|uniref:Uncharacterized protein n=1 Tax=Halosimplex litoreum TaxID=1198301 RepID=A0A7T3KWL6_9EURY|nr:hypothetical protein [Halosimplex litoreum]QPV64514.1 hypothetical protein I7X12_07850 [Halosimplex litoreum]